MNEPSVSEHEKMKKLKEERGIEHVIAFLEWLPEIGLSLCEYKERPGFFDGEFVLTHKTIERILAEYLGIDLKKIQAEKEAMFDHMRQLNEKKS